MQALEFLQGLGWITVAAYCLNNLGLVPPAWVDAVQSKAGIPTQSISSPSASPSPSATPSDSGNEQQKFTTQQ